MNVTVFIHSSIRIYSLQVDASTTVQMVRTLVQVREGLEPSQGLAAFCLGQPLDDGTLLSTLGHRGIPLCLGELATLYIHAGLLGGKVRGQTPKVELQEKKKKKKTGRAKRRNQHPQRRSHRHLRRQEEPNAQL